MPLGVTELTADTAWIMGAHFSNTGAVSVTVIIYDGAGHKFASLEIPAGAEMPYEWPFRPTPGVKWIASAAGLLGHIWGYK